MDNFLDSISGYFSSMASPNIVRGSNGYMSEDSDTRFKPRAAMSDFLSSINPLKPRTVSYTAPQEKLDADRQALMARIEENASRMNLMPPQTAPQAPIQAPQPMQNTENDMWSMYGRPSTNPYSDILTEVFGENAPIMESILRWGNPGPDTAYGVDYGGENLSYNPSHVNVNTNGSRDLGLFQINEDTFADYNRRMPNLMQEYGLNNYDELVDPRLNALMAKIILENQGTGAWYGAPPSLRQ